ncbi:MAG: DNA polymerase I [Candidatus Omnitrophica bacterium]|nr:DNA polymerase I [Candidatus Omnitrophota bacterium]
MSHKKLFLIDAHALCYRSFYAIKNLYTSNGQATNAVYGFVNAIRKILNEYKPDYLVICFDSKEKTFRQKKYAAYKIQRPKMPDDLVSQIPIIKNIIGALHLSTVEKEGFEADDLIAYFAKKMQGADMDIIIVSDDKDMFQLVNEHVFMYNIKKNKIYGLPEIKEKLGFDPHFIPDYIALAGDQSDNIPGVRGIGEVTARKLIQGYGGLESIYDQLESVSSATVRTKLEMDKDMAFLSKELALLEAQSIFSYRLEDAFIGSPDQAVLFRLFSDLEFRKFAQEYAPREKIGVKVGLRELCSADDVQKCIRQVREQKQIFFQHVNVQDELFDQKRLFVYADTHTVFCVKENLMAHFQEVWNDQEILKVTYDIKSFYHYLLPSQGEHHFPENVFDVLLAAYLLFPSESSFDFSHLTLKYLNKHIGSESGYQYQVHFLRRLHEIFYKDLEQKLLSDLFKNIEMPLAWVLASLEVEGVALDKLFLEKLSLVCDEHIEKLTKDLYKEAGEEFNLNSPKQLSHILFEKLKLPVIKKTKTGYSTNESVLTILAQNSNFPARIIEYRHLAKLKSTYIDTLPKMVSSETGRIHTQFNQVGTETGRLSSSHPNLQNIPVRTEFGKQIRQAFISVDADVLLISADYSQIELRLLAHLSQDPGLIEAFRLEQDIHSYTASLIFEVPEDKITKQMRYSAKRVNFGIVYGMSAFGLAKDLNIPQQEAQSFIDRYFIRYPNVQKFMQDQIEFCEKNGFVKTILNRRRYIPEIHSKNHSIKQFAQRQAINTPVQGSAADLIKMSMVSIFRTMKEKKFLSKMLLTVHDELIFEVVSREHDTMVTLMRNLMENPLELTVPIKVSVKEGKNWLEMDEIKGSSTICG